MESNSQVGLLRNVLESALFPNALEHGGYDKIPVKEVVEVGKVALVATIVLSLREAIESVINDDYSPEVLGGKG